jgi:pimeloyl-ACP methyl ester carboxylesterase
MLCDINTKTKYRTQWASIPGQLAGSGGLCSYKNDTGNLKGHEPKFTMNLHLDVHLSYQNWYIIVILIFNEKKYLKMNIQPFEIHVSDTTLYDLQKRLAQTRWPDEIPNSGWNYGTDLGYLKELVDYWQHKFNWREQEVKLNKFHQFKAQVDGVNIHFIHMKGKGTNSTPIILTHGWPDSFYRFYKVIPMLTDPEKFGGKAEDSFDVVIPSLPGFGFSDRKAMTDTTIAELWAKLMTKLLGYKRFTAAGGDLGSGVTKALALKHADVVAAIHLTDVGYLTGLEDFSTMSEAEQQFASFIQRWLLTEGAYIFIQSTKPQTLGYGLNDSPIGLASWIVEKFYAWSDCKGKIENRFTKDELLTNIMIYWITETINSSIRMYSENARATFAQNAPMTKLVRSQVPAAVALFPADAPFPREWAERNVNLKRWTKMPRGGHFAALEEPELFVSDLREFFQNFRK